MKTKQKSLSLFSRIFIVNLVVVFIAFTLISLISYTQLRAYTRSERVSSILAATSHIVDLSRQTDEVFKEMQFILQDAPYPYLNYNKIADRIESNYRSTLITVANSTNFSIMKISPNKEILFRYADINAFNKDIIITPNNNYYNENRGKEYIVASEPLSQILSGTIPSQASTVSYLGENYYTIWGDMDNLFTSSALTVMKPIFSAGKMDYLLMLFIPAPQINILLNNIASNFIVASIISLIVSIALSYALSYRISKPLKAMNEAAMKLASGDFSMRVNSGKENTVGEISELITTFNDMAESLQSLEENQRSFTASIAHELRTPMTSIIGFIDSILDGTIPKEKADEYLKICLTEARRLSRLVTGIMDVSQVEFKMQKIEFEPFDINECIRRQIVKYQDKISEKDIEVFVEFDNEECICLCDSDSITRVVINILDNAIKFVNSSGYIKVDVHTSSGKAYVSIENSGNGISNKDLKHVFDKFYKTDRSRGLDKNGIGLGLYLVKNIISLHDESIEVSSEEGKFTRFTFTLKLDKSSHRNK